jgi:hypothetical protein
VVEAQLLLELLVRLLAHPGQSSERLVTRSAG